jgi:asparagine synthase (glutamine-hydrolysing)
MPVCGIYGFWGRGIDRRGVETMGRLMRHRGPDDHGIFHDESRGLWLGHERLAIIDLSAGGHQPMTTADQPVVVCFNGEIYNFEGLRRELEGRGERFHSHSDTEVLLRGYLAWGERVVDRLHGMFAFAIWDGRSATLLLARDATGIKPLFYGWLAGGFVFASEMKALAAIPGVRFDPDRDSVNQYMALGYVWDEHKSILPGVLKLPPGHLLRVAAGETSRPARWWKVPVLESQERLEPAQLDRRADELYEILNAVVAQHLVADVPVGLLLSGGLDSSVLAAIAARQSRSRVQTLSIGFEPCDEDERPFARAVAGHLGTDHRELVLRPDTALGEFEKNAWFYDDLFYDVGLAASLAAYRACRSSGLKVVLVGEGADELFGGYTRFSQLCSPIADLLPDVVRRRLFFRQYSGQNFGPDAGPFLELIARIHSHGHADWFSTLRHYEMAHQLPNNLNMKVDRASMAASVEARVPYQDRRVVESVCALPRSAFLDGHRNKLVLRHMASRHRLLPREIIERPKLGMLLPGNWLQDSAIFSPFARKAICEHGDWARRLGLQDAMVAFFDGRERRWTRFFRRHLAYSTVAWRLFVLEMWSAAYSPEAISVRLRQSHGA